jgi:hypothetical protein
MFMVPCSICRRPIWLPFKPKQPKRCEKCYAPRDHTEVEASILRRELGSLPRAIPASDGLPTGE